MPYTSTSKRRLFLLQSHCLYTTAFKLCDCGKIASVLELRMLYTNTGIRRLFMLQSDELYVCIVMPLIP